jgi:GGDEF domain-containing protein
LHEEFAASIPAVRLAGILPNLGDSPEKRKDFLRTRRCSTVAPPRHRAQSATQAGIVAVAANGPEHADLEELLHKADALMYAQKQKKKAARALVSPDR